MCLVLADHSQAVVWYAVYLLLTLIVYGWIASVSFCTCVYLPRLCVNMCCPCTTRGCRICRCNHFTVCLHVPTLPVRDTPREFKFTRSRQNVNGITSSQTTSHRHTDTFPSLPWWNLLVKGLRTLAVSRHPFRSDWWWILVDTRPIMSK